MYIYRGCIVKVYVSLDFMFLLEQFIETPYEQLEHSYKLYKISSCGRWVLLSPHIECTQEIYMLKGECYSSVVIIIHQF